MTGFLCDMQSTESQFIGAWDQGTFVEGTWALQDGSQYNGQFGNKVKPALFSFCAMAAISTA